MEHTVEEYFETHPRTGQPRKGDPANPSPWLLLVKWLQDTGPVCLIDPGELPDGLSAVANPAEDGAGLMIPIARGEYDVMLQVADYGLEARIAGMRVAASGATVVRGEQIGTTATDTAVTALLDPEDFRRAWPAIAERWEPELGDEMLQYEWGVIPLGDREHIIVVSGGFGDGEFPVFALVDANGGSAGFEVEFFPVDRPYPF